MKKNITVIGCGHWGKNLVRNFYEIGALHSICDPDITLCNSLSEKFGVKVLTFDEILNTDEIDGVVLAVPAPLHASMAIQAFNKGKHVYVEKPLAMNEIEAKKMIQSSIKNQKQLMVGHLLQYHPIFMRLKEMVINNNIGSLEYIYSNRLSFGKMRSEEDVIWSFAPHDISMILSLINEDLEKVKTVSSYIIQQDIADIATIHLDFANGLKSHISVSWLHPYKEQKLVVIGKEGMLVFDDTMEWSQKLALYEHKVDISNKQFDLSKAEVDFIKVPQAEPLRQECQYFVDLISGIKKPLTDGDEGLRVLKVLSLATLSQSENKTVKMNNND